MNMTITAEMVTRWRSKAFALSDPCVVCGVPFNECPHNVNTVGGVIKKIESMTEKERREAPSRQDLIDQVVTPLIATDDTRPPTLDEIVKVWETFVVPAEPSPELDLLKHILTYRATRIQSSETP